MDYKNEWDMGGGGISCKGNHGMDYEMYCA